MARRGYVTVGSLRAWLAKLENVPDDTKVIAPAPDHSYRGVRVRKTTALYLEAEDCWTEDHGEELTPAGEEFGQRVTVLVVE